MATSNSRILRWTYEATHGCESPLGLTRHNAPTQRPPASRFGALFCAMFQSTPGRLGQADRVLANRTARCSMRTRSSRAVSISDVLPRIIGRSRCRSNMSPRFIHRRRRDESAESSSSWIRVGTRAWRYSRPRCASYLRTLDRRRRTVAAQQASPSSRPERIIRSDR
jgi:hypothetical protein